MVLAFIGAALTAWYLQSAVLAFLLGMGIMVGVRWFGRRWYVGADRKWYRTW